MKIGLSTNGKTIDEALFQSYRDAGINAMEISTAYDKYADLDYPQIEAWAKEYGITLWSFHLPFCLLGKSTPPALRSGRKH